MKIGLTGSIACGKSTVSAYLRELGYPVVDADAISHGLTAPGGPALPALRKAFGDGLFDGDALNRRALGSLVFGDPAQLTRLNGILHPIILDEIKAQLAAYDRMGGIVFGDVPLLYECDMAQMFDCVWVVYVSEAEQIKRLRIRDGLSENEALARIRAQMPLGEKRRLANHCICTEGSIEDTRRQVLSLIEAAGQRRRE